MKKRFVPVAFGVAGALFTLVGFLPVVRGGEIRVALVVLGIAFLILSTVIARKDEGAR